MVLDKISGGASRHLPAFDEGTRSFAYMLLLPLIDGVFATMLVSGYMTTFSSILNVAFTVFAGAGALAVLYSQSETVRDARRMVLMVAPVLIISGFFVGLLAPVFSEMFFVSRLKYAAGLAILVIALQIAGLDFAENLSVPAIVLTGFVLSFKSLESLQVNLNYLVPALATITIALAGLYLLAGLEDRINVNVIRKGGVLVLSMISASLFGVGIPSEAGLAVLTASVVLSLRR